MQSCSSLRSSRAQCSSSASHRSGPSVRVFAVARGSAPSTSTSEQQISRRQLSGLVLGTGLASLLIPAGPSHAGFQKELKKRKLSPEDYTVLEANGLKYAELKEGAGDAIKAGDSVTVHWDCLFRGIDVQSSRNARLLGGNRTIAEAYTFIVGEPVYGSAIKYAEGGGNSLFSGQGGPKPPQALSLAVVGMKKGGKRSLLVDNPKLGYGDKGIGEMPGNTTFELQVEVLEVTSKAR